MRRHNLFGYPENVIKCMRAMPVNMGTGNREHKRVRYDMVKSTTTCSSSDHHPSMQQSQSQQQVPRMIG